MALNVVAVIFGILVVIGSLAEPFVTGTGYIP